MIVVEASAIIDILTGEPGSTLLVAALDQAGNATTTPIAIYGATLGLRRKRAVQLLKRNGPSWSSCRLP